MLGVAAQQGALKGRLGGSCLYKKSGLLQKVARCLRMK